MSDVKNRPKANLGRRTTLRVLAVLCGLLPVALCEVILRVWDYPRFEFSGDPLIDASNLEPLFEPDPDNSTLRRIGNSRLDLFCPAEFEVEKPPGMFRIFALGGSTTFGEPYMSETAFPAFVKSYFEAGNPNLDYEVINCGGLSYASYRIRFIFEEIIQYSPDLVLLYTGHNEFLEKRSLFLASNSVDGRSLGDSLLPLRQLSSFKTIRLVESLFDRGQSLDRTPLNPTVLKREVDALLDYQGGLKDYSRGQLARELVAAEFEFNVVQMIKLANKHQIPLVVITPVSNLLDCPPFKIEPDPNLGESELEQLEKAWQIARDSHDESEAAEQAQAVLEVDAAHAGALFLLGRLAAGQGDFESAYGLLKAAKDADVCPLRAPSQIQRALQSVCTENNVPTVDAEQLFESLSENGIVGDAWLVDHIHPSIKGHNMLGEEIARVCFEQGIVELQDDDWSERAQNLVREQLGQLGEVYYLRAKQRLEGLQLWTQGRAKKVREAAE